MKRCVIVGGADINNYGFIRDKLCADDYVVFCDSGLKHLEQLQARPSLIVGDFDSHENPRLDVETIILPCEKDDTDTQLAVQVALEKGATELVIIGGLDGRLDHTLSNLAILENLYEKPSCSEVCDDLALPGIDGIENFVGL